MLPHKKKNVSLTYDLLSRTYDLVSRTYDLVSRTYDLVSRTYDLHCFSCVAAMRFRTNTLISPGIFVANGRDVPRYWTGPAKLLDWTGQALLDGLDCLTGLFSNLFLRFFFFFYFFVSFLLVDVLLRRHSGKHMMKDRYLNTDYFVLKSYFYCDFSALHMLTLPILYLA